jgi:hypothetical protein
MNIKYSKIILFICFVLCIEKTSASDEGLFAYLRPIRTYISTYLKPDVTSEELPLCFQRTGYVPVELGMNSPELLDFDLSGDNITRMETLLYNTRSLEQERNSSLAVLLMKKIKPQLEYYGYNPASCLTKDEFILDSYCVLAKNGYCPVFRELRNIFQKNNKLIMCFISNNQSIPDIETLIEYQGYLKRPLEKDIDDEEEDSTNRYRSSDSTDEMSDGFDTGKNKEKED